MKYKLIKDLPFLKASNILGYGCWAGGGLGVDLGENRFSCGGSAHNGTRVFKKHENQLLESLFENKQWIIQIPSSIDEALNLYDTKYFDRKELAEWIKGN